MISVIIPTRNRAKFLAACLETISRQSTNVEFEVLVIDNGSIDQTPLVIEEYRSKLPGLKNIHDPEPGLHTGRHAGMNAASGDVLVFADDDIEAPPNWLSTISAVFTNPNVAMLGGNNFPKFLKPPPDWLMRLWTRPTLRGYRAIPPLSIIEFSHPAKEISPYNIWGCNFSIRKKVLLEAGGFHPDGMPQELIRFRGDGETHVCRHVAISGLTAVFHPGASVYHKVTPERMTHAYFRQRGFNQGVSDSYTHLRRRSMSTGLEKRSSVKRALGYAVNKSLQLFDPADTRKAIAELKLGHQEGYNYHQGQYLDNSEVREWVHKPKYF